MTASSVNVVSGNQFTGVTFNTSTSVMVVPGHHLDQFGAGAILIVMGTSTSNDGYYSVSSSVISGANTNVTVASYSTGTSNPGTTPFVTSGTGTLLNFGVPVVTSARYWRVFGTVGASTEVACSELNLTWSSVQHSLSSLTITNLGSAFLAPYVQAYINDGIAETSNATLNIGVTYSAGGSATFDVAVDLVTPQTVTAINWAPQGDINAHFYNQPITMALYSSTSSATGPWTLVKNWSGYTVGNSNGGTDGPASSSTWNPGTYRKFDTSGTVTPP